MIKLKDFLLDINKTLSIPGIEALSSASDIATIEIDDETAAQTTTKLGTLMSIDAAKNNHDIEAHFKTKLHPTIKGELFGNLDTDLMGTAKNLFGDEALGKFKDLEWTGDKIKLFGELAKVAIESESGGDEKIKTINTELNKQIVDLNKVLEKSNKDHEKDRKKDKLGFETILIDKEFDATFNKYNLGDKYEGDLFKNALKADVRQKVSKIAKLTLSEDGQIIPRNPENDGLELFINGNKKVENLGDIMDPLMKDHIKVNNVGPRKEGDYIPAKEVKMSRQAQDRISAAQQENF